LLLAGRKEQMKKVRVDHGNGKPAALAPDFRRRRMLQGMFGAGALALAGRDSGAQSRGPGLAAEAGAAPQGSGTGLLRVAKQALVIGNSRYQHAPLRNPVNDANGMAEVLKSAGFGVTIALELNQSAMRDAIRTYTDSLARTKSVGLFYFAGHGAQLAWRNYLIPVDTEIGDIQELRERGVDVNSLIEGIRKAGNPMNMIILDACRDNPFGSVRRLDQKGLSQLDAPPGTLLAYATAPGNTAIDGEGAHGLYTEHLLKEARVPEAKVEDVFKRVRLAVRRRSNGLQIPWESTSLEEDFYFLPPRELSALADQETERRRKQDAVPARKLNAALEERLFVEELAIWERIKVSKEPGPLEDYLRGYPSGRFSELAQSRLDQVLAQLGEKKIEVVSAPDNPYTKGTVAANTAYRVGDFYFYREVDLLTKLETMRFKRVVTEITETEIIYGGGRAATDLLGNQLRFGGGAVWSPNQTVPTEFAVGRRWTTRFRANPPKGGETIIDLDLRIVDRESITVPAGTFNAFRIEAQGWQTGSNDYGAINNYWNWKSWYAPDQVRQPIAVERFNRNQFGQIARADREELVGFRQT
jgi:uncharacterized caspase-like protein